MKKTRDRLCAFLVYLCLAVIMYQVSRGLYHDWLEMNQ